MKNFNLLVSLLAIIIALIWLYVGLTVKPVSELSSLKIRTYYNTITMEEQPSGNIKITMDRIYPKILTPLDAFLYVAEIQRRDMEIYKQIPYSCTAITARSTIYVINPSGAIVDSFYKPFKNQYL